MDAWIRLKTALRRYNPEALDELQGPATAEEIEAAETAMSVRLPSEVVDVYRVHNGQGTDLSPIAEPWDFLSLRRSANRWSILKGILDKNPSLATEKPASGPIRNMWWSQRWIPIAHNGGGDLLCADLDPAEGGIVGQIITFWHEGLEREYVASSIIEWLGQIADQLEAGRTELCFPLDAGE